MQTDSQRAAQANNSNDANTGDDVQEKSCWRKFTTWFWGPSYEELYYAENRVYIPYWLLQTVRIVLVLVIYGNTIYRIIYNIEDGELLHSQVYFTTFGIYITLYLMTFLVISSFYFKINGFDPNNITHARIWKHHNLVMALAIGSEIVITVVYWIGVSFFTEMSSKVVSSFFDHSIPLAVLMFDFIFVGWVFKYTYTFIFIILALLYIPINASYTLTSDDPIYENISWKTYDTGVIVGIIMFFGGLGFIMMLAVSRCRYKRYQKRNISIVLDAANVSQKGNESKSLPAESVESIPNEHRVDQEAQ